MVSAITHSKRRAEAENPPRDYSFASKPLADRASTLDHLCDLRIVGERKNAPAPRFGCALVQPNHPRAQIDVAPLERERFHLAPAAQVGEVSRVAKVRLQVLAHLRPFMRVEESGPDVQVLDARKLRQAGNPAFAHGELQSSVRNVQLELDGVGCAAVFPSVGSVCHQRRVRHILGAHPRKSRQQGTARALKAAHAPQSAHARIIEQQLDRLLDSRRARQRTRAGLIDLPCQEPLRFALVSGAAALVNPAVADAVPVLPFGRASTLENRATGTLSSQLAQLGQVSLYAPEIFSREELKAIPAREGVA